MQQIVYHYCSFNTFEKIIKSKKIWLTKVINSNDRDEVIRIFKNVYEDIKKNIINAKDVDDIFEIIDNQIEIEKLESVYGEESPYVLSFSYNKDLVHNWQEYGDNGKGMCIGCALDFYGIKRKLPHPNANFEEAIGCYDVIYDNSYFRKELTRAIYVILNKMQHPMGKVIDIRTTLKHYSPIVKNATFKDEREFRIIHYPEKGHKNNILNLTYFPSDSIPHCELPIIYNNECLIKEIIIGNNCNKDNKDIENILNREGIDANIIITKSECTYRKSKNR